MKKIPNTWGIKPLKVEEDQELLHRPSRRVRSNPVVKPKREKNIYNVINRVIVYDYYAIEAYDTQEAERIFDKERPEPYDTEYGNEKIIEIKKERRR